MPVLPESVCDADVGDSPGGAAILAAETMLVESIPPQSESSACLLGGAAGPLAFRIQGSDRHGQVVRIAGQKCSIGAGPACTFRLRGIGAAPLNCLILRSDSAAAVRRWSPETRLNGQAFEDAPLYLGDRLAIGPLELEVIEGAPDRAPRAETARPMDQARSEAYAPADGEMAWRRQMEELQASLDRVRRQRDALLAERLARATKQAEFAVEPPKYADDLRRTEMLSPGERGGRPAVAENFEAELAQREAKWSAEAERQSREIETLIAERTELVQELDRLKSEALEAASARAAWEGERRKLEGQTQELQVERDELARQRDVWLRERAVLESGRLALATEVAVLGDVQSARDELAQERAERERLVSEAAAEKTSIETEVARLNQEIQNLQAAWSEERTGLIEAASKLESQAAESADKASLEAELVRLNLELHSQQSSWSDERQKLLEASAGREAQAEQLAEQLTGQLKRQLAESQEECEALQRERDSLAAQRNSAQMQRDALTEEVDRLTTEVEALSARIRSLEAELSKAVPLAPPSLHSQDLGGNRDESLGINVAGAPRGYGDGALDDGETRENVSGTYILPQGFSGFGKLDSPDSPDSLDASDSPAGFASLLATEEAGPSAGVDEATEAPLEPLFDESSSPSFHDAVRSISFAEPAPSPTAKPDEDGDESIEEYMQRLLMRARGEQAPLGRTTGAAPAQSAAPPSPTSPARTSPPINAPSLESFDSLGKSSSFASKPQTPNQEGAVEYSPRSTAPELPIDLAAMREVANTTTRSAIDHSARRRGAAENWTKLGLGVATIAGAAWLAVASGGQPNLQLLGASVGAIGGVYSIGRAGMALWKRRKLHRNRRG